MLAEARHAVLPSDIATTAFPSTEATCRQIGIEFDPWQRDLNRPILAKTAEGLYAADTVVMSIPRQVGKTFNVGALVFADAIINPGTTTVWTAHRFKVSRETFNELRGWARNPLLMPYIDYDAITTGAGNETIPFRNGSRIVFAARERGAIRGFTKVRRLILDEAQILTEAAMSDLAPTMNQAVNPQIIMMGTPPRPGDPGEVFTNMRAAALSGKSEAMLYVEFSADADAPVDLTEERTWQQVAKANPSFPSRTDKRAIMRLRKLLTNDDDFRREVYGIWDAAKKSSVFPDGLWSAGARDARPSDLAVGALGVAVTRDLTHSAIVAGARAEDGAWLKVLQHGPGTGWVVDAGEALQHDTGAPIVIDSRGPGAMLIPTLERAGLNVQVASTSDVLDACAGFDSLVRDGALFYEKAPELDAAVRGASRRSVGDRWAWGRKESDVDISPLEAGTLAVWAAGEPVTESVYEQRRGVLTV